MKKQNLIEKLELIQPVRFMDYGLKRVMYTRFCWKDVRTLIEDQIHFDIFNLIIKDINKINLISVALEKLIHGPKEEEEEDGFNVEDTSYDFLIEYPIYYHGKNKKIIRGIIDPIFAGLGDPFLEFIYQHGYKDKPKITYGQFSREHSDRS